MLQMILDGSLDLRRRAEWQAGRESAYADSL